MSLARTFRTHLPVKMPVTPSGKQRPCEPLLQLVVVALREIHSIGRSVDSRLRSKMSTSVILPIFCKVANLKKDSSRRAVWLGRHPGEKVSLGPKDKLIRVGNLE